ncbi:MAG: hypothetical protein RMJ45_03035 [Candidatus Calescibacterium sp.]|nr:hypothetical protein [Candidatus Calescibacterium sp.]
MFQISYRPNIRNKPMCYYDMVMQLIDSIYNSLEKGMNRIRAELIGLKYIRNQIEQINEKYLIKISEL